MQEMCILWYPRCVPTMKVMGIIWQTTAADLPGIHLAPGGAQVLKLNVSSTMQEMCTLYLFITLRIIGQTTAADLPCRRCTAACTSRQSSS